jgi:hypothetical protein
VIENISDIVIAVAAVIGLVPLGVRSVHDMIKNRRKKKNSDMWATVAVSVVAANLAPPVLKDLVERLGASVDQLPPWLKALITSAAASAEATPVQEATTPQAPQTFGQPHASSAAEGSPNGSSAAPTAQR